MDTVRITVAIEPFETWFSELLSAEIADAGFESFVETEVGFEAYIPENKFDEDVLTSLFSGMDNRFVIRWQKETIADRNWNEEWEKNYFQPLVISDKVLVRAPSCPAADRSF